MNQLIQLIADLAQEVNKEEPIDFGMLPIDDKEIWPLMASEVVSKYSEHAFEGELGATIYMATITKLVVENFVLNYKLLELVNKKQ